MYRTVGGTNVMREWIDWYDSNHTIYANARHKDVHFRHIAEDIAQYVPRRSQPCSTMAAVKTLACEDRGGARAAN